MNHQISKCQVARGRVFAYVSSFSFMVPQNLKKTFKLNFFFGTNSSLDFFCIVCIDKAFHCSLFMAVEVTHLYDSGVAW